MCRLCENGDLHTEIKRRAQLQEYYSEGEVMEIFVQILLGLCHVHNNKIVHRDLKVCMRPEQQCPLTIGHCSKFITTSCCRRRTFSSAVEVLYPFVSPEMGRVLVHAWKLIVIGTFGPGVVKLGDLGISKALSQTMEQCKSIVGTPYYMAPEGMNFGPS